MLFFVITEAKHASYRLLTLSLLSLPLSGGSQRRRVEVQLVEHEEPKIVGALKAKQR